MYEFILPDLGEGVHEGQIVGVLVKEGQTIDEFQPMLEVETDKAAVEIPAPIAGTVSKINVEAGQTVKVGDVMLTIDEGAASDGKQKPAAKKQAAAQSGSTSDSGSATAVATAPPPRAEAPRSESRATPAAPSHGDGPVPAAPVVRKLARELGVDLHQVPASGPNGRVLKEDVERFSRGETSAAPAGGSQVGGVSAPVSVDASIGDVDSYGPVRREKLSQIRKTIARQMTRAWLNVPRVTHCEVADITETDRNRKALNDRPRGSGAKITMTAIVLKAIAATLREYPMVNCSFDAQAEEVVYKEYVNLGVAVDTPRGLVVPVLRDVDKKSIPQVAEELAAVSERARDAKFEIAELRGATFTITNVGALGGTYVTPMVNFPEVGILGLGRATWEPRVLADMSIAPRLVLPLSLSFDHRICDGADAARFMRDVVDALQNPLRLISL